MKLEKNVKKREEPACNENVRTTGQDSQKLQTSRQKTYRKTIEKMEGHLAIHLTGTTIDRELNGQCLQKEEEEEAILKKVKINHNYSF